MEAPAILWLPYEILVEIFLFANQEASSKFYDFHQFSDIQCDYPTAIEFPRMLQPSFAQVCSQWRATALECSQLWCTLAVFWTGDVTDVGVENKKRLCEIWIKRSGAQSLSVAFWLNIWVFIPGSYTWRNVAITKIMLEVILPHLHRLRCLRLHAVLRTAAEYFKEFDSRSLPLLETLLLTDISERRPKNWQFGELFTGCSRLRVLGFDLPSSSFANVVKAHFQWNQLTRFYPAIELHTGEVLQLLQVCAQLEELILSVSNENDIHLSTSTKIASPLRCLVLASNTPTAKRLMPFLLLPKLTTFRFIHIPSEAPVDRRIPIGSFSALFTQSQSPLTTLCINADEVRIQSHSFIELAKSFPNLENLSLVQKSYYPLRSWADGQRPWLKKDVMHKIATCEIFPRLKDLRLECPTGLDEPLLLELLERRVGIRAGCAALQYLFVAPNKPIGVYAQTVLKTVGLRQGKSSHTYTLP